MNMTGMHFAPMCERSIVARPASPPGQNMPTAWWSMMGMWALCSTNSMSSASRATPSFLHEPHLIFIAQTEVAKLLQTFKDPPSQRAASSAIDQIVEKMQRQTEPATID
jgi:hypothetical protein